MKLAKKGIAIQELLLANSPLGCIKVDIIGYIPKQGVKSMHHFTEMVNSSYWERQRLLSSFYYQFTLKKVATIGP